MNLQAPPAVEFKIDNQTITIDAFNSQEEKQNLHQQPVNIIASGPSIANLDFAELADAATIFVNGSISLLAEYDFTHVVGWVISDARFVSHQPEFFVKYYMGQPLYATSAVFEALALTHPSIIINYHHAMRILYPVNRQWTVQVNQSWFSRLISKPLSFNKKRPLSKFAQYPNFIIDTDHKPEPIGVSLDITGGFVEAGTVAYVAAQLAYSRCASAIHLYGIDLLNSDKPRFYENKTNYAPSKLNKAISERIVPSFNLLGKSYKQHNVAVINHSPVSKDLFDNLD